MIRVEDINVKSNNKAEELKISNDILKNAKVEICTNKTVK